MLHRSTLLDRLFAVGVLVAGCGGDEKKVECSPDAQTGCSGSQACELVDQKPTCVAPVVVTGHVVDLSTGTAVANARVVALDVNSAPVASVVTTGADGVYSLPIRHDRQTGGAPVARQITLQADAQGYAPFPSGLRLALPIDTGTATLANDQYTVSSAQTEIKLEATPGVGTGSIAGTIDVPTGNPGVLVVAETGTAPAVIGYSAVADDSGSFVILNLDAGDYTVRGFAQTVNYDPQTVTVTSNAQATTALHLNATAGATVSGSVQIVAPGEGTTTSVVLAIASTFDSATNRGVIPAGLRAAIDPASSTSFGITGVPDGRYVALAAYENDHLVRDPDTCIGGTTDVFVDVTGGQAVTLASSFKITGAVELASPGADGPQELTAPPVITWTNTSSTSSAAKFNVAVYDSYGGEVWNTDVANGTTLSADYAALGGPALVPGDYYQVRITSLRSTGGNFCVSARSEDLKGVFYIAP